MSENKVWIKKLDNMWYHYKWWILFAFFLILVIWYSIWSAVTQKKYDYTVSYISYTNISYNQLEEIESALIPFGQDINSDGEITFDIQGYNMGIMNEDPNTYAANIINIQNDFNKGNTMLFILDRQAFEYFQKNYGYFGNVDGTSANGAMELDSLGWNWKGTVLYSRLNYAGLPEEMYLVMRTVEGTKLESNINAEKRLEQALELFKRLRTSN